MKDIDPKVQRIMESTTFLKAEDDNGLMKREELRPVRLQLELLKPELIMHEHNIESTIVVFGSARTPTPEMAEEELAAAKKQLEADQSDEAKAALARAEKRIEHSEYYEQAREFGRIVSSTCQIDGRCEYVICTGGGPGIMEAVNRGAFDVDAKSVGLNIELPHEQYPNAYITPELCFNFRYFAIRKMHFLMRAKALVAFPGGFGTLDELCEALTLIQTSKQTRIPVVLLGRRFWDRIMDFEALVDEGVINKEDLDIFQYADSPEEAWNMIWKFYDSEAQ